MEVSPSPGYQDKILEQLEKTLAKPLLRAPAEKKLAPLEVGPAVCLGVFYGVRQEWRLLG